MGLQLFGCVDFSANYGNIVNKDNKVPRHVSPEPPVWAWPKNDDHSMHLGFFSFEKQNNGGQNLQISKGSGELPEFPLA